MVSRWGLSLLLVCAGPSVLAQEALHRWVDESGRVHYSDQIPPERVNQPHQVLDKQGRRVQDVGAAKTPEERAAEEAARKVRLEREAQEKAERELQAREDQRLLMVYNSEEALVRARQARLESFDRLYDLEKDDYARILKDLRELEKAGSAKEDDLRELERLRRLEVEKRSHLAQREAERDAIQRKFELDLARLHQLLAERKH